MTIHSVHLPEEDRLIVRLNNLACLAVLGLHRWADTSLAVASGGCSLVAVCWLLSAVTSLVTEHRL